MCENETWTWIAVKPAFLCGFGLSRETSWSKLDYPDWSEKYQEAGEARRPEDKDLSEKYPETD